MESAALVAVIAMIGTVIAAWLSSRAHKHGSKVQEKVAYIEAYDELVAHLRARITELQTDLDRSEKRFRECYDTQNETNEALDAARAEHYNLVRIIHHLRSKAGLPPGDPSLPPGLLEEFGDHLLGGGSDSTD